MDSRASTSSCRPTPAIRSRRFASSKASTKVSSASRHALRAWESGSDPNLLKFRPRFGSRLNSWVVAGARTESGKPLLANDPHLGLTAPPLVSRAPQRAGLDVIGATLPGVPGRAVGRNDRVAWGFTNTGPDVQDLYLEKLDTAGNYLTPQGPRSFEVLAETIRVKGAADEALQVRASRHGPIVSDVGAARSSSRRAATPWRSPGRRSRRTTDDAGRDPHRPLAQLAGVRGLARSARAAADGHLCRRRGQHRFPWRRDACRCASRRTT